MDRDYSGNKRPALMRYQIEQQERKEKAKKLEREVASDDSVKWRLSPHGKIMHAVPNEGGSSLCFKPVLLPPYTPRFQADLKTARKCVDCLKKLKARSKK